MLYPKNVPNWERAARVALGLILLVMALSDLSLLGNASPMLRIVAVVSATVIVVTGFVGWCPACALVGRRLKK